MASAKNTLIVLVVITSLFVGLAFASASSVSVWQGQYYTGTTFNTGTYSFNFTVYDALTGGTPCFTNTTSLTTGTWGQWKTEQGPWAGCNNASKDYFLNINIGGVDETPRRRLTISDFLRRDATDVHEENLTADYYFGDGQFLIGVNGSGDINSVQGDEVYLYNGSDNGIVLLAFNETKLNNTIDLRATGLGDNESWNESYADTKYIIQSNESNLNVNSSNSTTWWAGLTGWLSEWFVNNGSVLEFNETKFNETVDSKIISFDFNDTQKNASGPYLSNDSTTIYFNDSLLNSTITNIVESNQSDLNVNSSLYSNETTWWAGLTDWVSGWFVENASVLEFNETKLNETIANEGVSLGFNSTFNSTYDDKADYQFGANDFNGTGDFTTTGNITAEEIHLENDPVNHRIYDNSSCVIIRGDTSTMYIC